MNDALTLALGSVFEKQAKDIKPEYPQGSEVTLDTTVILHIVGTVKKGNDTTYTPTSEIPFKLALALFLEKAGYGRQAQRQRACDLLAEAMQEALAGEKNSGAAVKERMTDIDKAMGMVQAMTAKLPAKNRSGSVRVNVNVQEVEPADDFIKAWA